MKNDKQVQFYKTYKTIDEQIEYLSTYKNVEYIITNKDQSKRYLSEFGYVNVITPFKHCFAKLDNKHEVMKERNIQP